MQRMTHEEAMQFLFEKPRPAIIATLKADGRPHVTPIWIAYDGQHGEIVFTTWHESLKAKALQRDGRIALCVDDDQPPFSFVTIEGTATATADDPDLRHWAGIIGSRYMGADQAESYGNRNGVPGELLVRVTIEKVVGFKVVAA